MNGDMNKAGETYNYAAYGSQSDFDALPALVAKRIEELRTRIALEWKADEEANRRRLSRAAACLDRLAPFLLQTSRVAAHSQKLVVPIPPGSAAGVAALELCADFESLLFHGRACLDVLAGFVSWEYGPAQQTYRYSRLANVLRTFGAEDKRAARLLKIIDRAKAIPGALTNIDTKTALRSKVAHQTSLSRGATRAFSIHSLDDASRLIFDCESLGYPVMATSRACRRMFHFSL